MEDLAGNSAVGSASFSPALFKLQPSVNPADPNQDVEVEAPAISSAGRGGCGTASSSAGGGLAAGSGAQRRQEVASASVDPDFYKNACGHSAVVNHDLEDIYRAWDNLVPPADLPLLERFVRGLIARKVSTQREMERAMSSLRREHRGYRRADGSAQGEPRKSEIMHAYLALVEQDAIEDDPTLRRLLVKKASKSLSGVLVVTVLTSPYPEVDGKTQKFSCEWNCYYCPNEPGQPRSYLHDEPSVLRANRNNFDPVRQFTDRCATLAMNGHPVDKIELLVLGGTWTSYPHAYQQGFARDLFFAANTFYDRPKDKRAPLSLSEEKALNEVAKVKIIGLTLETRPDCIDAAELRRMRSYGCTRVQVGLQHTDDGVLGKINRGCTRADAVRAVKLLKDSCFKLDMHLMPNLPGATQDLDRHMFQEVLYDPGLSVDQWKIYPCEITPWTVIKQWFEAGTYVPYSEEQLADLLLEVLPAIPPWVRVNRVVRDIPSQYILAGMDRPNLRQVNSYVQNIKPSPHSPSCFFSPRALQERENGPNGPLFWRRILPRGHPTSVWEDQLAFLISCLCVRPIRTWTTSCGSGGSSARTFAPGRSRGRRT